jgi:hypothetical protein
MDEILQKLLESELLSEETKNEVSTAITAFVEETKQKLREEATLEVRTELAEQWVAERDALIEKIDIFFEQRIAEEVQELKDDIDRFRDLEAEYAEKLVEEKRTLAEQVDTDLESLIDKIDSFFEVRLAEELEELKEDLQTVRENDFGRRIFEAFVNEFGKNFVDEESVQTKLNIAEGKLRDASKRLSEIETEKAKMLREKKMEEVLAPLSGSKREQMAFILQNVETTKLNEAYNLFIGRVLKEATSTKATTVEAVVTKDDVKVITEAEQITEAVSTTTVVTGDKEVVLSEEQKQQAAQDDGRKRELEKTLRLAGVR